MPRPIIQQSYGFQGTPMKYFLCGVALLIAGTAIARQFDVDNKIENTKRHHPKGIGYSGINHQMDLMREQTRKLVPKMDEHNWEYTSKRKRHIPGPFA